MPKTKISEFSATPGNNTDIDGINIAEGCAPSGINDAIRELMSQLKDFQAGTAGDSFNGPVGTTTAAAGAFTTLSASGTVSGTGFSNYLASPPAIGGTTAAAGSFTTLSASSSVTLSGGTANGVPYLNGSKVLTTGSALTFDGTNLSATGLNGYSRIGDGTFDTNRTDGMYLRTLVNSPIQFLVNNTEQMRLTSTGLGIGTSSPGERLDVYLNTSGNVSAKVGNTSGSVQLLQSNGIAYLYTAANQPIAFSTNNTERMRLDSSGNLGLGVTPSAWASNYRVLQMRESYAALASDNGNGVAELTSNAYNDGSWRYANTGIGAVRYQADAVGRTHKWYTAPSGTAGNAISFTQAMTLDANGRLGIATTSPGADLSIGDASTTASRQIRLHGPASGTAGGASVNVVNGTDTIFAIGNASNIIGGAYSSDAMLFFGNAALRFYGNSAERARIDSSGNFIQSAPTTPPSLATNGTMVFNLTSNTNLRISVRGSDGVTRTANIILV